MIIFVLTLDLIAQLYQVYGYWQIPSEHTINFGEVVGRYIYLKCWTCDFENQAPIINLYAWAGIFNM